jgi:hypothetical protein
MSGKVFKSTLRIFTKIGGMEAAHTHCMTSIAAIRATSLPSGRLTSNLNLTFNPFYVGATSSPNSRANSHARTKGMSQMHLLCELRNRKDTINLEKRVVQSAKLLPGNLNRGAGGEGVIEGINYLYLLTH